MRKRLCAVLAVLCVFTCLTACRGRSGVEVPANWPSYAMEGMTFPCEPGWEKLSIEDYGETAQEVYSAFADSADEKILGILASPEGSSKNRNLLSVSYLPMQETVTDNTLNGIKEQMKELQTMFLNAGKGVSVLTDPELDTIGEIKALFYTVEFTMENNQKVIVRTALTGRDNRLYAFQHLDFQRTGDSTFLRKILAGLVWA
ncbi:MAG: hypothetical protein II795_01970 [Firmicutes bacterium]|nr:hypothetical protein [Bacillota bacterium]